MTADHYSAFYLVVSWLPVHFASFDPDGVEFFIVRCYHIVALILLCRILISHQIRRPPGTQGNSEWDVPPRAPEGDDPEAVIGDLVQFWRNGEISAAELCINWLSCLLWLLVERWLERLLALARGRVARLRRNAGGTET